MKVVVFAPDLMDQSRIRATIAAPPESAPPDPTPPDPTPPDPNSRTRDKPRGHDPTVCREMPVGGDEVGGDEVGREVVFVRRVDSLGAESVGADLVLVDLSRPGVLDVVGSLAARTVGFGSHVDDELLAAARAAGCDEVLPRSRFFRTLATLLA